MHKTIAAVTDDLEKFHFNKAVARIRELSNQIDGLPNDDSDAAAWAYRFGIETVVVLLAPMTPHICEEMWSALGHSTMVVDTPWPSADDKMLEDDTVTIGVQVNGKLRGTIDVAVDADKETTEALALALENVQSAIADKTIKKVIVVPKRIVNIVA